MTLNFHPKYKNHSIGLLHLESQIGNTPLVKINQVYKNPGVEIYAKLEWKQLSGSIKARAAFQIIRAAIKSGRLNSRKTLLDATSGNTGIAYGHICKQLGIPVTLCVPENISSVRKKILIDLGVKLIYTSQFESTDGAQIKAKSLARQHPEKYFHANQYSNENNWKAHYFNTAEEIWGQTQKKITHFISGLGTTGTFTGTSRGLKRKNSKIKTIGLQPNNPMHGLEGWKHLETALVPPIFAPELLDDIIEVDTMHAFEMVKTIYEREQLLVGPSAAANLVGAIELAKRLDHGIIVTTFADDASKYEEALKNIFKS